MPKWGHLLLLACLVAMATAAIHKHKHSRRREMAARGRGRHRSRGRHGSRKNPILNLMDAYRQIDARKPNFDSLMNESERLGHPLDQMPDLFSRGHNLFDFDRVSRAWDQFSGHVPDRRRPFQRQRDWWQGPNICETRKEESTNETDTGEPIRYHFTASILVCDVSESAYKCVATDNQLDRQHKTTTIFECCHGYTRKRGDFGCPKKHKMKNLLATAEELGLSEFLQAIDLLELTQEVKNGNYTVFAPVNDAFKLEGELFQEGMSELILKDAPSVIEVSEPALEKTLNTLRGAILAHMLMGSQRSSSLSDEQVIPTGHPDGSTIRINYFARPSKMMTANCVPVLSRDNLATNGVIHTVAKALSPVTESLLDMVRTREDLTMLKTVLAAAAYVPKLEEDGKYTLLAPTNDAFKKMNPRLRERLLNGDKKCIESVLFNHMLPHVICSAAFQKSTHTMNLLNKKIGVVRNHDDKLFADNAQVVDKDIMALNGVMHVIDDVLIPEEALGFLDVLKQKGFTELISLIEAAGLEETLNAAKNVTLFAPTNEAIQNLPLALKSKLGADKDLLKKVLTYHVSPDIINTDYFRNEKLIPSLEGRQVRLNRFQNGLFHFFPGVRTAQCAVIEGKASKTCNGNLNVLSKLMIPPQGNLIDVLSGDKRFSTLVSLLKKADMVRMLEDGGPFTIFAPNNEAFRKFQTQLRGLEYHSFELILFLKSHISRGTTCCSSILRKPGHQRTTVVTLMGSHQVLTRNRHGNPMVSYTQIIRCDRTASNGNILELNKVLYSRYF